MTRIRPIWRPLQASITFRNRCQILTVPPRRWGSTATAEATTSPELANLEPDSSLARPPPARPVHFLNAKARSLRKKLPASRYKFHPPKYNRGRLHPIQSPPSSDPVARDFIPGPFNVPRLKETYQTTLASDIMTLTYLHTPPGTEREPAKRSREWDGSSPYHKNRPPRGARGKPGGRRAERNITFTTIPELREISVATYVPEGIKNPDLLVVAQMVLQSITGVVPELTKNKTNVAQWGIKKGDLSGVKATMYGDRAYEFLDRCVHLVFPRIKDWKGIRGSTGDGTGNLGWGMAPQDVELFPEIEVNRAAYPQKKIPGLKVSVKTTATSDRQARLLLHGLGLPFYGALKR